MKEEVSYSSKAFSPWKKKKKRYLFYSIKVDDNLKCENSNTSLSELYEHKSINTLDTWEK